MRIMNIIQTFYSYEKNQNPFLDKAGFLCPEFNWMSMALSCILLKKHYGKVSLYCNRSVKKLIEETFQIPYTEVIEVPDFMDRYEGYELWALPKLYTYSLQTTPFLHVDCDWFMFDRLSEEFLSSDLYAQNIEYDDQFYNRKCIDRFVKKGGILPEFLMEDVNKPIIRVANAGIIGGNDIVFFNDYLKEVSSFITKNDKVLQENKDGFINSIYEQMFFYSLAKKKGKSVHYCTEGDKLSTKFEWLQIDYTCKKKHGYMHLLSHLKREIKALVFVSRYLEYLDPDLHHHIIKTYIAHGGKPLLNYFDIDDRMFAFRHKTKKEIFARTMDYLSVSNEKLLESMVERKDNIAKELYELDKVSCRVQYNLEKCKKEIYFQQRDNANHFWEKDTIRDTSVRLGFNSIVQVIDLSEGVVNYLYPNKSIGRLNPIMLFYPDPQTMRVFEMLFYGLGGNIIRYVRKIKDATPDEIIRIISSIYFASDKDPKEVDKHENKIESFLINLIDNNILRVLDI